MKVKGLSSVACKNCNNILTIVEQDDREILVCGICGHAEEMPE